MVAPGGSGTSTSRLNVGYDVTQSPVMEPYNDGLVAAWSDTRTGSETPSIVVAVLDADGGFLGQAMRLSGGYGFQEPPSLACRGVRCLVVWWRQTEARAALVDLPTRTASSFVAWSDPNLIEAHVATNGTGYYLAYRVASDIWGLRLDVQGQPVLPATPVQLSVGGVSGSFAMRGLGTGTLITWSEDRGAGLRQAARLVPDVGAPGTAYLLGNSDPSAVPAIATHDPDAVVLWVNVNLLLSTRWSGAAPLDAMPTSQTAVFPFFGTPAATYSSGNWWFTFRDGVNNLFGARLDFATNTTAVRTVIRTPVSSVDRALKSALGPTGAGPVVVWTEGREHTATVRAGTIVDGMSLSLVTDALPIDATAAEQRDVVALQSRDRLYVAWAKQRADVRTVEVVVADPSGQPQHPVQVVDATESRLPQLHAQPSTGAVAVTWFDETQQLWFGDLDSNGTRLTRRALDSVGFFEVPQPSSAATVGTRTVLVWSVDSSGKRLRGAEWSLDGGLTAPVDLGGTGEFTPRLAASATDHVVVWRQTSDIEALFVTRLSASLGVRTTVLRIPTRAGFEVGGHDVASNGVDYLVVWSEWSKTSGERVRAQRVSGALTLLDSTPFTVNAENATGTLSDRMKAAPRVTFDGRAYAVSWVADVPDGGSELGWRGVSSQGIVDVARQLWPVPPSTVAEHGIVSLTPGRIAGVWSEFETGTEALRARVRTFGSVDLGEACVSTGECRQGFCAPARCCSLDGGGCPVDAGMDAGLDAGQDAGIGDAGADAGSGDAGVDAGDTDAGVADAGSPDAGPMDAGDVDAGETDAGLFDAGRPDAGTGDAGTTDAGPPDAGDGVDAGRDAQRLGVGCGCSETSGAAGWLVLVAAIALGRTRRSISSSRLRRPS